jgi:hypothetical protein
MENQAVKQVIVNFRCMITTDCCWQDAHARWLAVGGGVRMRLDIQVAGNV